MHKKNILFSWNICLYLPHNSLIMHSIWAQIDTLLGFFKYFIYQMQGKGVFLNTVFNIGLDILIQISAYCWIIKYVSERENRVFVVVIDH